MSAGLVGSKGIRGRVLTIADDLVARIALYVAVERSAKILATGTGRYSRSEANTTRIFLVLRVVKTLLHGQSPGP